MLPFPRSLRLLLCLAILAPLLLAPLPTARAARDATPPPSAFYGLNWVTPFEPWVPIALDSGARAMRWQFSWRDHEISPGEWIWSPSDMPMSVWNNAGFQMHAVMHNPPDFWRAERDGLMPRNLDLPWNHPHNGWGHWCYTFASRYRGQVASYEVWNEPDLDQYWNGTAREYYRLLSTCYDAIKAADPGVTVMMGSMALLIEPAFFGQVVRLASQDSSGPHFDAVGVHVYASPELSYTLPRQMRSTLARYELEDTPIWITETGLPVRGYGIIPDTPGPDRGTEEEQAWYVLQSIANAHAGGASRVMFYRFGDDYADAAHGLIRIDLTRRPSYQAFQNAVNVMRDIVSAQRTVVEGDVVIVDMQRADGVRVVLTYAQSGREREVRIPSLAGGGTLINTVGEFQRITAQPDGYYTLTLPAAPGRDFSRPQDYAVGGPVLMIVE